MHDIEQHAHSSSKWANKTDIFGRVDLKCYIILYNCSYINRHTAFLPKVEFSMCLLVLIISRGFLQYKFYENGTKVCERSEAIVLVWLNYFQQNCWNRQLVICSTLATSVYITWEYRTTLSNIFINTTFILQKYLSVSWILSNTMLTVVHTWKTNFS